MPFTQKHNNTPGARSESDLMKDQHQGTKDSRMGRFPLGGSETPNTSQKIDIGKRNQNKRRPVSLKNTTKYDK